MKNLFFRLLDEVFRVCVVSSWLISGAPRFKTPSHSETWRPFREGRRDQWINASAWTFRYSLGDPYRRLWDLTMSDPRTTFRLTGLHDA